MVPTLAMKKDLAALGFRDLAVVIARGVDTARFGPQASQRRVAAGLGRRGGRSGW